MAFHRKYYSREQLEDRNVQMALAWWPIEDIVALKQLHIAEDYEYKRFIARMLDWEREQAALRALERRYSADQPRVPAGSPDGGQWVGNNGGGASGGLRDRSRMHGATHPASTPPGSAKRPQLGSPNLPSTTSQEGVLAGDPSRDPTYNGVVIRDPVTQNQPQIPKDAQPLLAPNGQQVFNPNSTGDGRTPQFIYFPPNLSPDYFIREGSKLRDIYYIDPYGYDLLAGAVLYDFRQGGIWDAQRVGGSFHPAYVDYATVAIGLWGASAKFPEETLLQIQNQYAALFSHFPESTPMDSVYTHLPIRNVTNTKIGYDYYRAIGAK